MVAVAAVEDCSRTLAYCCMVPVALVCCTRIVPVVARSRRRQYTEAVAVNIDLLREKSLAFVYSLHRLLRRRDSQGSRSYCQTPQAEGYSGRKKVEGQEAERHHDCRRVLSAFAIVIVWCAG